MRLQISAIVSLSILVGSVSPLNAQSLGELAKKSEAARQAAKKGGKVYTNADAGNVPAATSDVTSRGTASDAGALASGAKPEGGAAEAAAEKPAADAKDQTFWSNRMKTLRAALDRDTVLLSAMQTQINSLTTDFVNRDDPAQRSVIEQNRTRALSELDRLQKTIEADKKAIADAEDEARRANVPPGWLR